MSANGTTLSPRKKAERPTAGAAGGGVQVAGLRKSFGTNLVLDDVSFELPEGSVATLLGASGSGKTTTLRILAGLEQADSGEVWIGGERMAKGNKIVPAEQRGVGLVFQSYALWPHMRIFDQIAYPLRVRKMSKQQMREAVEETARIVGLGHLLDRLPSQLSGGQQQRVAIARALVFGPGLLLLDEPLSNLDAALRRQTRMELQRLQDRVKVTTIYVTHDQQEAMAVSDVVVVMNGGKVVTIDTPRAIYDRPVTEFVASFVGSSNLLRGEVLERDGQYAVVRLDNGAAVKGVVSSDVPAGSRATIAVKPVDVTVRNPGDAASNVIPASVSSTTYLGDQIEMTLDVAGEEFRASLPRWEPREVGDQVEIFVPAEQVTVIRPDDSLG